MQVECICMTGTSVAIIIYTMQVECIWVTGTSVYEFLVVMMAIIAFRFNKFNVQCVHQIELILADQITNHRVNVWVVLNHIELANNSH